MAKTKRNDQDSPWKEILGKYFPHFMELMFPQIFAEIDWDRKYESLETELQKIVSSAKLGRRLADKLMKVYTKTGKPMVVLLHIEIQGRPDKKFGKRMFVYYYRIVDKYDCLVVSLGVLCDGDPNWRPDSYSYSQWGCSSEFRFPIVKLLDYRDRWEELEASKNPFATVIMAQLKELETKRSPEERKHWKLSLIRRMYEQGFTREVIWDIFHFIDWLMTLPDELAQQFEYELETYEKERNMPYITSIERRGIEKGRQEGIEKGIEKGRQEGRQIDILDLLEARFHRVSFSIKQQVGAITDEKTLRKLLILAAQAESMADFEKAL